MARRTDSLGAKASEQHHRERSDFSRHVELYLRPLTSLARGLARRVSTVMRVGRARLVGPDTASHRVVDAHITEIERCFSAFGTIVPPGGLICHHVDLSAHDADDPFAFYYGLDVGAGRRRADDLNGLRLSTILHDDPLARHRLTPRFRHYAEEDLRWRRAVILARKRA